VAGGHGHFDPASLTEKRKITAMTTFTNQLAPAAGARRTTQATRPAMLSAVHPSRNTHDTRAMQSGNLRHTAETLRTRRSRALHDVCDFRRFVVISY
jgi:hypothetical protein